jgi:phospholipase C
MNLDNIKTIVLLMFENRSFDHMLGHLSLDKITPTANGLQYPLTGDQYENIYNGDSYYPFRKKTDTALTADLPHEYNYVATQINKSEANGRYGMDGFVTAYMQATGENPNTSSPPMGFYGRNLVPITSFLAGTYAVCDKWHAPLPTSTQPNRTMAFCGDSSIHDTKLQLIPADGNIFDWMNANNVKWRVYHDGLSFFILYNSLWHHVLGPNFRDYENLFSDLQNEADDTFPQVIVVEPSYQDSPHFGSDQPNDNHPPLAIGFGEEFLRRTYDAVIANPKRWGNTVMIVYYDEHGGFFDHVAPPKIGYATKGGDNYNFESLGVRIPGIIISPFVKKKSLSNFLFDHTSVLQMLAEKFTPGKSYSDTVDQRKQDGIHSISEVLTDDADPSAPPAPSQPINVKTFLGDNISTAPTGAMAQAFEDSAINMMTSMPDETRAKYPELFQWKDSVDKSR